MTPKSNDVIAAASDLVGQLERAKSTSPSVFYGKHDAVGAGVLTARTVAEAFEGLARRAHALNRVV